MGDIHNNNNQDDQETSHVEQGRMPSRQHRHIEHH